MEISSAELSQRVAVVKRFRELLKAQRDRFNAYLFSLDRQKDAIEGGTADDLLHHVELEEKIVSDIYSIQKVIDPLEKMYKFSDGDGISGLKESLKNLKSEAVVRSGRNKQLLSRRMSELRTEIRGLRNNPYARRGAISAPAHIDIRG